MLCIVACGGGSSSGSTTSPLPTPTPTPTPISTALSCDYSVSPKGERLLGMDYLDTSEAGDFDANAGLFSTLGGNFTALHLTWAQLEPTANQFEDPGSALASLKAYLEANALKLVLVIRPIDLTGKTVPSDLASTRFNDTTFIARFQAALNFTISTVGASNLLAVHIGNEIDGFNASAEHTDFWSDYGAFLTSVNGYVDTQFSGLPIGFTATWGGLVQGSTSTKAIMTALGGAVDLIGVTYYPLDAQFGVRAADDVHADFNQLVNDYSDVELMLTEVGYPSSSDNTSSERGQAEFYCELLKAWDDHSNRIPMMNIVRMNDYSLAYAQAGALPYGIDSVPFIEYLRSLGLRNHTGIGSAKPAWSILEAELNKRGW